MGKEEEVVGDEENRRKRVQFPHLTTARHASDQVQEWKRTATGKKIFPHHAFPNQERKKLVEKTNSPHSPSFLGEGGGEGNMVWHTEEKIVTAAAEEKKSHGGCKQGMRFNMYSQLYKKSPQNARTIFHFEFLIHFNK